MNTQVMQLIGGQTFRGLCDTSEELPVVAEPGDVFGVGDAAYVYTERGTWDLMSPMDDSDTAMVSTVEQTLSKFEGVTIMLRLASYSRIKSAYPYPHPVRDCEPVGELRKRLETTWPGCDFEIMDGRSIWDHTHCMTMGQLRNSYLMSRTPE